MKTKTRIKTAPVRDRMPGRVQKPSGKIHNSPDSPVRGSYETVSLPNESAEWVQENL